MAHEHRIPHVGPRLTEGSAQTGARRRYGGRSPEERRAARRARLLEAALELYGSRGYPATTIEQICGEAGVTARHFYEEFATREALLVALYDALIARVLERVREAIYATGKASLDIVYDGVRAYFENVTEDPRRARILMLEVVGVSAALERHRRDSLAAFIAEMVQSTQRLEQAGLHPGIDTELLSAALVGAGQQLTIEWVLAEGKLPVRRLVDVLSAIWIRCLELDTKQVPPNG